MKIKLLSIGAFLLIAALLGIVYQNTSEEETIVEVHELKRLVPGVKAITISKCGCASSTAKFLEMVQYVNANDEYGLAELVNSNFLFLLKPRTEVQIINDHPNDYGSLDIRVLSGKYEGERCLVPKELVK